MLVGAEERIDGSDSLINCRCYVVECKIRNMESTGTWTNKSNRYENHITISRIAAEMYSLKVVRPGYHEASKECI